MVEEVLAPVVDVPSHRRMTKTSAVGETTLSSRGGRRVIILAGAMIATFVATRVGMLFRPNADLFIAGFNIHHLYTGVVLLTACVIPLLVGKPEGKASDAWLLGTGAGLALILDEVVFLVATDGSNGAYFSARSWIGGILLIVAVSAYCLLIGGRGCRAALNPE